MQAQFNQQAIDMLPQIKQIIEAAPNFEANQMKNKVISECMNSSTPISEMSADQLKMFQVRLIGTFKHYEWM